MRGILQGIDPNDLERAFRRHADSLDRAASDAPSRFIAIDGKTLRQSFNAFADRKTAHGLGAIAVDHKIIPAHEIVDDKPNEIPAKIAKPGGRSRRFLRLSQSSKLSPTGC